jgi:hypothetical protein
MFWAMCACAPQSGLFLIVMRGTRPSATRRGEFWEAEGPTRPARTASTSSNTTEYFYSFTSFAHLHATGVHCTSVVPYRCRPRCSRSTAVPTAVWLEGGTYGNWTDMGRRAPGLGAWLVSEVVACLARTTTWPRSIAQPSDIAPEVACSGRANTFTIPDSILGSVDSRLYSPLS